MGGSLLLLSGRAADLLAAGHAPWARLAKPPGCSTIDRMRAIHLWLLMPALLIGLGGCSSYDPPIQGNHKAEKYQTDLTQCRTTSRETVRLRNARTLESWVISPFTGPPVVRADIRKCMQGKGYVLEQG